MRAIRMLLAALLAPLLFAGAATAQDTPRAMPVFVGDPIAGQPSARTEGLVRSLRLRIATTPGLRLVESDAEAAAALTVYAWFAPGQPDGPDRMLNYAFVYADNLTASRDGHLVKSQVGSQQGSMQAVEVLVIANLMKLRDDLIVWQDANPVPAEDQ
jgi:hypothetical protein